MSELSEIKERLASLETLTTERWDAHDRRSEEKWEGLSKTLQGISTFMLGETARRKGCMDEAKNHAEKHTNKVVSLALGIPASICAVIGVFVMIHKLIVK